MACCLASGTLASGESLLHRPCPGTWTAGWMGRVPGPMNSIFFFIKYSKKIWCSTLHHLEVRTEIIAAGCSKAEEINKYAIYAYTHGPVTGSGPSVKPLRYDVAPYRLS